MPSPYMLTLLARCRTAPQYCMHYDVMRGGDATDGGMMFISTYALSRDPFAIVLIRLETEDYFLACMLVRPVSIQ